MPLVHLNVKFVIDGNDYDVETFKINFEQAKDFKGQPTQEVSGGQFMVTISQLPDDNLLLWAKKSTTLKSGSVIFYTDLGTSVYRLIFTDAYCVTLANYIDSNAGARTSLMIAPNEISLDEVEHKNRWNK